MADIPFVKRDMPPIENHTEGKYTDEECIRAMERLKRLEAKAERCRLGKDIDYHQLQIDAGVKDLQISYVFQPDGNMKIVFELRDWDEIMRMCE